MAAGEFGPDEAVFLVNAEIIGAIGMLSENATAFAGILGDVGVHPAIRVFFLEALAGIEEFIGGAEGKARGDGVEIAALMVIFRDEFFAVAVEIVRGIHVVIGRHAVNAGESCDDTHVSLRGFVEKCFGGDRGTGGVGLTSGGSGGEKTVKETGGSFRGVSSVFVFDLLREDPFLQPGQQLFTVRADDARLWKMNVSINEAGQNDAVLDVVDLDAGITYGDVSELSVVFDDTVLHDEESIREKACGGLFVADVFPGIVNEVNKDAANASGAHGVVMLSDFDLKMTMRFQQNQQATYHRGLCMQAWLLLFGYILQNIFDLVWHARCSLDGMMNTALLEPSGTTVRKPESIPLSSVETAPLPHECTFTESDWRVLAPFWYPVAFARDVTTEKPFAVRLLDERLVIYRLPGGTLTIARDICLHRGIPLSMGYIEGNHLVCMYHGLRFNETGACVKVPSHSGAGNPSKKLCLRTYPVQEKYGLIWTRLVDTGPVPFPEMEEWDDPDYLQVLPDSVLMKAAAGRQVEGFLDVSHFAFVHAASFGEPDNPEVPNYPVKESEGGFIADYVSTVSNYPHGLKHLNPPGFMWRRLFRAWLPFTAKLTVFFPHGQLHVLNAASPISARKTRLFVPICRNFDKDAPLQDTLDFNHQVFAEDQEMVENQYPEDLPIDLQEEVHIRADKSSITYRKMLGALGLGRTYTA